MNIAVIGGGAAGIYYSILRKQRHPEDKVTIFEKEERIGRKILATGNGHCNLLNKNIAPEMFNNPVVVANALNKYSYQDMADVFESWGIPLMDKDGLIYPLSYSAKNIVNQLISLLNQHKIAVKTSSKVLDYTNVGGKYYLGEEGPFDRIVFATGGCSSPKLGSDGSLIGTLKKHGYKIADMQPGLCPIKVKEKGLKAISGIRHHASVSLWAGGNAPVYIEEGEVLFKDDGLSGIVIFNVESQYVRHYSNIKDVKIQLDLFPEYSEKELFEKLESSKRSNNEYLLGYLPKELIVFLSQGSSKDNRWWASELKNIMFTVDKTYGFDSSQVSIGGVLSTNLKPSLESKSEKGVYFLGELVNIDGICGGFNLSWALLSALIASE